MSTPPLRLARSHLFAPGSSARLVEKVFTAGADAVVLDLEDAVPASGKDAARTLVRQTLLARRTRRGPLVYVRINAVSTGLWEQDLAAVVLPGVDGVRLAKAESRGDVDIVAAALDDLEAARGIATGTLAIVPTIESACGVHHAAAIAAAPRVAALAFGATDFTRDIGAGDDDVATLYARSHLVVASRVAGVAPPIAPVFTQLADTDGLRRSSEASRRLGFFGRTCIHPSQLAVVHDVFTPSAHDVARARSIIEGSERASRSGVGAFALPDGEFVDRAVVERARAVLALADGLPESRLEGPR